MNVVFAGRFPYPAGSASASRIRHMAAGLHELGHRVFVISMAPQPKGAAGGENSWFDHEGVSCYRAAEGARPAAAGLGRKLQTLHSMWVTADRAGVAALQELHARVRLDVMIGMAAGYADLRRMIAFCTTHGVAVVRDVVEWWQPYSFPGGPLSPVYWNTWLNVHRSLPRSSGIIAISRMIARRYESLGMKVVRIPAIINPDGWMHEAPETPPRQGAFRITYLGNLNWRDEPLLIVRALRETLRQGADVALDIVGSDGRTGRQARRARSLVESDPVLGERIRFLGWVSDEEVRGRLLGSDALLFTRVSGKQAESAFPTRLPEYLMTGWPVISTAVGDIPLYLRHGVDAILVRPGSVSSLAEGMARLAAAPDRGRAIGSAGRQRCTECFHYRTRSREISEFLETVVGSG